MSELIPFSPVAALDLTLEYETVSEEACADGDPRIGARPLIQLGSTAIGIWEMTVGGMFDTEVDEVFVVLAGSARIAQLDEDGHESRVIEVSPGMVCRLTAGMRTRWDVSATLRKVYLLGTPSDSTACENTSHRSA